MISFLKATDESAVERLDKCLEEYYATFCDQMKLFLASLRSINRFLSIEKKRVKLETDSNIT